MKKKHITITGLPFFYGKHPFEGNEYIVLTKDFANPHDSEAIIAETALWGMVGFVSNHPLSRIKGTISAGRLYDKIGKRAVAKVKFSTDEYVICKVVKGKRAKKQLKKFDASRKDIKALENMLPMDSDISHITVHILSSSWQQDLPGGNANGFWER